MERLTKRISLGNGKTTVDFSDEKCGEFLTNHKAGVRALFERVAEYEDLEEQLESVYGEHDGLLETMVKALVRHEGVDFEKPCKSILLTDEDAEKWKMYKSLEEQGMLLKLPCKVGDIVYEVYHFGYTYYDIDEHKVKLEDLENIGKTVFLTRAEAEKALAEMG